MDSFAKSEISHNRGINEQDLSTPHLYDSSGKHDCLTSWEF